MIQSQKSNKISNMISLCFKDSNNKLIERNVKCTKKKKFAQHEATLDDKVIYNRGKWTKEEHLKFLSACHKYGKNWSKIQSMIKSRSSAQLRSHAQKYIIKLCRRYQIKIKSKKFKNTAKYLLLINNRQKEQHNEITDLDKKLLNNFNYYNREYKPFSIKKIHRCHEAKNCIRDITNKNIMESHEKRIFKIEKNYEHNKSNSNFLSWNFPNISACQNLDLIIYSNEYFIRKFMTDTYEFHSIEQSINYLMEFYLMCANILNNSFNLSLLIEIKKDTQIFLNLLQAQNKNLRDYILSLSPSLILLNENC